MKRLSLCILMLAMATTAFAGEPTRVVVRVLAHDAKLIGDVAGGSAVVIRERDTGKILAEGYHRGSTGSTTKIIEEPWVRGQSHLDTENAAAFRATLDLDAPTWVTVEARGPLGFPAATTTATRTLLLLPGHHVEGDGIVLTLQGLVVNLLAPHTEQRLESASSIDVRAGVKLMCTCPVYEGSHWEANDYDVAAELWDGDDLLARVPLSITDEHNVFAGTMTLPAVDPGKTLVAELRVVAANDGTGNFGFDRAVYRIRGPEPPESKD